MIRLAQVAAVVALAGVFTASASATESTIYPGVGIGKVKLGMTLTQVRRLLGAPQALNAQGRLAGQQYTEYGWNFSEWRVGFIGRTTKRAVLIGTAFTRQRLSNGVGIGTPMGALRSKLPVACRTADQDHPYRDPATESFSYCTLAAAGGRRTIFNLHSKNCNQLARHCDWFVGEVIIRAPV
jgi:hypothetical protein